MPSRSSKRYREACAPAAPELSLVAAQVVAPPAPSVPDARRLEPAVALAAVWVRNPAEGVQHLTPLRTGAPLVDQFGVQDYVNIQQWFDGGVPHGRRYHCRSEWLDHLDLEASKVLAAAAAHSTSTHNQVLLPPRVAPSPTSPLTPPPSGSGTPSTC